MTIKYSLKEKLQQIQKASEENLSRIEELRYKLFKDEIIMILNSGKLEEYASANLNLVFYEMSYVDEKLIKKFNEENITDVVIKLCKENEITISWK